MKNPKTNPNPNPATHARTPILSSSTTAQGGRRNSNSSEPIVAGRASGVGGYYSYANTEHSRQQKQLEDERKRKAMEEKRKKEASVRPQIMQDSMAKLKDMTGDFFSQMG